MDDRELRTKLAELMGEISTLPAAERRKLELAQQATADQATVDQATVDQATVDQAALAHWADEQRQRNARLRQTVCGLQESLDYLRLSIKYLVFDLEATRRENGRLKRMLEEASGNAD